MVYSFQSTPSAWRVTQRRLADHCRLCISIHTLRVEGDEKTVLPVLASMISIHTLRVEGDN